MRGKSPADLEGSSLPSLALPYRFDTIRMVRLVLRLMLGLFVVIIAGVLYSLLVSADRIAGLALLVTGAVVAGFLTS